MSVKISELSKYSENDLEKIRLVEDVYNQFAPVKQQVLRSIKREFVGDFDRCDYDFDELEKIQDPQIFTKYCPECNKKYPKGENVCMDCLVHLKDISSKVNVKDIDFKPQFIFNGKNSLDSFEEILSGENLKKINEFEFNHDDYMNILYNIKSQAFKNFDDIVKTNEIIFDELNILDKIILFVKSFVKVDYKSSGGQLGYFEENTVFIDDRQTRSLQITTLIHEVSHFIIHEILTEILCKLLDTTKNSFIEEIIYFVLSYSSFTQLIDEYSAHNVEGRFTVFGFQDYSSFIQIVQNLDGEMSDDDIEITKSIGNTFALSIKEILESLIDSDLREDIKDQFMKDVLDRPNYRALEMENYKILNEYGLLKAIWLILNEGCEIAALNIDKLKQTE
nr:hypothetical protein [uncultured Methanobrevibacter sp.]